MEKPSDYFRKLDLAHLDVNTAQFIREKVLTLPNIDILSGTKEFETLKAIIEENFPRAIGIEPKAIEPIIEIVPEVIIEEVIAPVIDTKQVEIDSITTQVSEMSDLIELMNEVVAENKDDLDSKDILELYNDTLVDLKDKLSRLSVVILDAIEEVKENIEEVKEIIKTDVIDSKGILTAPKKYKTEDGEEVLGYESDWNFGLNNHLGETVVYYVSNEDNKNKYSVLTGILHKGEVIYSTHKTNNKEFENYSDNESDALAFAYELANDKEALDKFEKGGGVYSIPHDVKTTGIFNVKEGNKTSEVKLYGAEKENNNSYSFYQSSDEDARAEGINNIIIKNSDISKLSKGITVNGINQKNGNKVKVTRIADLFKDGGSIGFIPMDLEEELSWVARFGGMDIKGVIGILSAMNDAGITKEDLELQPSKTSAKREKIKDAKIKEVWAKVEPFYKGDLKGNMYYSTTGEIIRKPYLLEKFKPWRKTQKFANGGEIKNLDKIKKSIGDTIYNHISSLNEEQLEKQLKELKVELKREYLDSKGNSRRYKELNDEMYYILYRLERADDDFKFHVGDIVSIIDAPKSRSNIYVVVGHENYNKNYGWETTIKNEDEKVTMFENLLEKHNSNSDKDNNIATIRFNDLWKNVQVSIDGSLYEEFDTYQEAINYAKNANSKVIILDDVTMLNISESNPLSNQLSKITGDGWNDIDYKNLGTDVSKTATTARPFEHIATGKIFEVVKK
jgi:hypothetical protein